MFIYSVVSILNCQKMTLHWYVAVASSIGRMSPSLSSYDHGTSTARRPLCDSKWPNHCTSSAGRPTRLHGWWTCQDSSSRSHYETTQYCRRSQWRRGAETSSTYWLTRGSSCCQQPWIGDIVWQTADGTTSQAYQPSTILSTICFYYQW